MRSVLPSAVVWRTALRLLVDVLRLVSLEFTSRVEMSAENLFLRKQLALDQKRHVRPRRRHADHLRGPLPAD